MNIKRYIRNKAARFISKSTFIHIPKTGGTYVSQSESEKRPVIWPFVNLGHCCIIDEEKEKNIFPPVTIGFTQTKSLSFVQKYYVFSVVRNIYSWLVSYTGHAGGWNKKYFDTIHYDYKNAQKGFEYLIKTIANRDNPWPLSKIYFFPIICR